MTVRQGVRGAGAHRWPTACAGTLGRRWLALDTEARDIEAHITGLIKAHGPQLLALMGVGPVTAAQLLVTAGSNPAGCAGTLPWSPCAAPARSKPPRATPVGTGSTGAATGPPTTRYGSLPTRMISDPRTRAYVAKRTRPAKPQGDHAYAPALHCRR